MIQDHAAIVPYLFDRLLLGDPLHSEEERNRIIKTHDLNVLYLTGPGHGEPALVASAYLEGT